MPSSRTVLIIKNSEWEIFLSYQDRFLLSHLCNIITVDRPKEMELYVLSKTQAGNNKPELLLQAWANTAFLANTDQFFPFNLS